MKSRRADIAIQIDVKFLSFKDKEGKTLKAYLYTAIDDAGVAGALKIYSKHNRKCAIDLLNYVMERFPFSIHTLETDNGDKFQARFHRRREDLGIRRFLYQKSRFPSEWKSRAFAFKRSARILSTSRIY